MGILSLKQEASSILCCGQKPPRTIFFLHAAIAIGLSLVLALISEVLDRSISTGGGLSGMSTQAALSTAQVVLQLISTVAMPFWSAGLIHAALRYAKGNPVGVSDLMQGFRRFAPILTSGVMMGLQYLGRGFVSVYVSSVLVMLTPFSAPAVQLAQMITENPQLDPMTVHVDGIGGFYAASLVIFLLVFGLLALPIWYRYRMVSFIIMDNEKIGGLKAMLQSRMMMHRRGWKLFRLDLSFWWFYALELAVTALSMGSLLAPLLGLSFPFSDDAAYWLCQLAAAAGHVALYALAGPKVKVTYALCYQQFLQQPEPPKPRPPKDHPWTY